MEGWIEGLLKRRELGVEVTGDGDDGGAVLWGVLAYSPDGGGPTAAGGLVFTALPLCHLLFSVCVQVCMCVRAHLKASSQLAYESFKQSLSIKCVNLSLRVTHRNMNYFGSV